MFIEAWNSNLYLAYVLLKSSIKFIDLSFLLQAHLLDPQLSIQSCLLLSPDQPCIIPTVSPHHPPTVTNHWPGPSTWALWSCLALAVVQREREGTQGQFSWRTLALQHVRRQTRSPLAALCWAQTPVPMMLLSLHQQSRLLTQRISVRMNWSCWLNWRNRIGMWAKYTRTCRLGSFHSKVCKVYYDFRLILSHTYTILYTDVIQMCINTK